MSIALELIPLSSVKFLISRLFHVRVDLHKAGVELRENIVQATPRRASGGKQDALPYYGFCYFEGRIAPDPRVVYVRAISPTSA
jgi:hypothetical protein